MSWHRIRDNSFPKLMIMSFRCRKIAFLIEDGWFQIEAKGINCFHRCVKYVKQTISVSFIYQHSVKIVQIARKIDLLTSSHILLASFIVFFKINIASERWEPRPRLNIKTVLSRYGDSYVKDKTAVRTSYL